MLKPESPNPYRPPTSVDGIIHRKTSPLKLVNFPAILFACIAIFAYGGFSLYLIFSGPGADRFGGLMCLAHLGLFMALFAAEWIRWQTAWRSLFGGAIGQLLVMGTMLAISFGSPDAVIDVNSIITGIWFALAVVAALTELVVRATDDH